jgi:hypothetical protein
MAHRKLSPSCRVTATTSQISAFPDQGYPLPPQHRYFYFIPKHDEWWIGDWIRQRHGYVTRDVKDVKEPTPHTDPLQIPGDGWTYYDPTMVTRTYGYTSSGGWQDQPERSPISITAHTPGLTPEDHPEAIEMSGHEGYQKDKMGVWKRTHWIMAEVHRIDRVQGKVEVVLKQQHRSYTEAAPTDLIKGIDLYGDQIVEPGTHLIVKKRVSQVCATVWYLLRGRTVRVA